ncbi:hypothetical protein HY991_04045 [Candidatus Micrarchaeota archaeon]|nr:hypothetical protein [Candidatus Micrarchaeota archaeon]
MRVSGDGRDECRTPTDCENPPVFHFECNAEKQCIKVNTPGISECDGEGQDDKCKDINTYSLCDYITQKCVSYTGPGKSDCANDDECKVNPFYTKCVGTQCVITSGVGRGECRSEKDCAWLKLTCPFSASSPLITVKAKLFIERVSVCKGSVELVVSNPDGTTTSSTETSPCSDGSYPFELSLERGTGNYKVVATYSDDPNIRDECIISFFQPPPVAFPELHPLAIFLIAFAALFLLRKRSLRMERR